MKFRWCLHIIIWFLSYGFPYTFYVFFQTFPDYIYMPSLFDFPSAFISIHGNKKFTPIAVKIK